MTAAITKAGVKLGAPPLPAVEVSTEYREHAVPRRSGRNPGAAYPNSELP
jgi:hypothetical protein